jgi:hypothetical protein
MQRIELELDEVPFVVGGGQFASLRARIVLLAANHL